VSHLDAQAFAVDWIAAFNAADLPRMLSHYAPTIALTSPVYLRFTEGRTDTVSGLADLETYFSTALARYPGLHFTLLEVATGTTGLCIRYHTNLGDRIAMECFERGSDGKALRVICHYVE
jgi:ketosteroid isomerase-like protein